MKEVSNENETKKKGHTSKKKDSDSLDKPVEKEQKAQKNTSEKVIEKAGEIEKERKEPQMITVNGDKVSHAHIFKSNQSDDWFFTAKINDVPLKPQKITPEDCEAVLTKTIKPVELMEKYYPSKLAPQKSAEEFKIPTTIMTGNGEETIHKFNVYKEKDQRSYDYGKYRFYVQIGNMKMSQTASKEDLNAYFDRTQTPKEIITKVFGEKLHLADYYKQFKLPEGVNIEMKDIRIMKNQQTNRYEISVNLGQLGNTPSREISYDDRQSFFTHKTATKDQLAAKYLSYEISKAYKETTRQALIKQPSLGI